MQLLPASYWDVKYRSEVSCWLSTRQLSVIIYEHKAGAPRSNTEKFTQPLSTLISTIRVLLLLEGCRFFRFPAFFLSP